MAEEYVTGYRTELFLVSKECPYSDGSSCSKICSSYGKMGCTGSPEGKFEKLEGLVLEFD
jgi:hypothetical protein